HTRCLSDWSSDVCSSDLLAQFRVWLKTQYAELAALNTEWETQFSSWDEVKPFTTDQIKNRMSTGDALPRGKPDWQALQALKFSQIGRASCRERGKRWSGS